MSNEQKNVLDSNSGKDFADAVLMAGVMMMMLMLMMPVITHQISAGYSRVQTLAVSPETIAQNVGLMWYEMTALGHPNRLKMVGENSSGAFEEILLALST